MSLTTRGARIALCVLGLTLMAAACVKHGGNLIGGAAAPARSGASATSETRPFGGAWRGEELRSARCTGETGERADMLAARLEALRRDLLVVGMSAAVVKDQELLWASGFGYADMERGTHAGPHTPYQLASLTKPVAATLMLALEEDGILEIDDPVSAYGISLSGPETISVRHLLSHTSEGIPGQRFHYNGTRYSRLTNVIERASGQRFRDLLVTEFVRPLSLTDTAPNLIWPGIVNDFRNDRVGRGESSDIRNPAGVVYSLTPSNALGIAVTLISSVVDTEQFDTNVGRRVPVDDSTMRGFQAFWRAGEHHGSVFERLARPYRLSSALEPAAGKYSAYVSAAAGLVSSVVDLAVFDAALDRGELISDASRDRAFAPTVTAGGDTLPYGLGWFSQTFAGERLVWHYGYWDCCSALFLKVPDRDLTFIVAANTENVSGLFSLGEGDVLNSPLAVAFLEEFVFGGAGDGVVDWSADVGTIVSRLRGVSDPAMRELMRRELGARCRMADGGLGSAGEREKLRSVEDALLSGARGGLVS